VLLSSRKSWHTSLRIRKKSEKREKENKKEVKLENGYRKSREGLTNKVSVKVTLIKTNTNLCLSCHFLEILQKDGYSKLCSLFCSF